MTEFVYLIGSEGSPIVKIGRSTDVPGRLAAIQFMSPLKLTVLWQTEGGAELEAALHRHFKSRRSHGEWFEFSDGDAPSQVMQAIAEIAAEEKRKQAERRQARKYRKIQRVWKTSKGRRVPPRPFRRPTDTLEGFLVEDVVSLKEDGESSSSTYVIIAIHTNSDRPYALVNNDGRSHHLVLLRETGTIVRRRDVPRPPKAGWCDHTNCICAPGDT